MFAVQDGTSIERVPKYFDINKRPILVYDTIQNKVCHRKLCQNPIPAVVNKYIQISLFSHVGDYGRFIHVCVLLYFP